MPWAEGTVLCLYDESFALELGWAEAMLALEP